MKGSPTCNWTRSIQHAFRDAVPLHPSIDLLRLHDASPYFEGKLSLCLLDKPPLLSLSHDGFHLVCFDVLVPGPLA